MYGCCLYPGLQGSNGPSEKVLSDLGWKTAAVEKRVALAILYSEVGTRRFEKLGRTVTEASMYPEAFDEAHPFTAREAHSQPDGGVVLRYWVERPGMVSVAGYGPTTFTGCAVRRRSHQIKNAVAIQGASFGSIGDVASPFGSVLDDIMLFSRDPHQIAVVRVVHSAGTVRPIARIRTAPDASFARWPFVTDSLLERARVRGVGA